MTDCTRTNSLRTARTEVKRLPARARYDRDALYAILDEGLVCHVGFVSGAVAVGQPMVIPTTYARQGDKLLLHGSPASRMLRTLASGVDLCVTVTLLDGLVLARSAFHHSMNYRSAVVMGTARPITDDNEKASALAAIVEHVVPGRGRDARPPSAKEAKGTLVLSLPIDEASSKVRTGPPLDDHEDLARAVWAGVIPLTLVPGRPEADPHTPVGCAPPPYATTYRRPQPPSAD